MPELPEVETVRRGLEPVMLDRQIKTATTRRPDLRWPFPANFSDRLSGARVKALRRRAKYILADLDSDETLLIHLGMSGRMLIQGNVPGVFHRPISPLEKHDHVIFDMETGARIVFNDPPAIWGDGPHFNRRSWGAQVACKVRSRTAWQQFRCQTLAGSIFRSKDIRQSRPA